MRPPKFTIKTRHRTQARRLGYTVAPSKVDGKKLDVFDKNGKKVASIGAKGYWDYASYLEAEQGGKFPKGYAASKREQYRARHSKESSQPKNTAGYLAYFILW
jgi:hypothetical protein